MKLALEKRPGNGTRQARRLRRAGKLPAIIYSKGEAATSVALDLHGFEMAHRAGEHTIEGILDGAESIYLIQEVQLDALGDHVLHVDLRPVGRDERVQIQLVVEGYGDITEGVLEHQAPEIEVECLASAIPDKIEVNVGVLKIGDVIRLADLPLPEGTTALGDPESPIFSVHAIREEEGEEAEQVEEADSAEPERIGGKAPGKEEEGD